MVKIIPHVHMPLNGTALSGTARTGRHLDINVCPLEAWIVQDLL